VVLLEADSVAYNENYIGECYEHDSIPDIKEQAERHNYEVVDVIVLFSQPKFCLDFIVL
jgi:hypothetical protein